MLLHPPALCCTIAVLSLCWDGKIRFSFFGAGVGHGLEKAAEVKIAMQRVLEVQADLSWKVLQQAQWQLQQELLPRSAAAASVSLAEQHAYALCALQEQYRQDCIVTEVLINHCWCWFLGRQKETLGHRELKILRRRPSDTVPQIMLAPPAEQYPNGCQSYA